MDSSGTAQREAWDRATLPPVEQPREGLRSIPVPIPDNPLRSVSVHVFALAAVHRHLRATRWNLAAPLTWSRPWERHERRMRTSAVTGTDAHLRLPAARGLVVRSDGPVPTWTLAVR